MSTQGAVHFPHSAQRFVSLAAHGSSLATGQAFRRRSLLEVFHHWLLKGSHSAVLGDI